MFNEEPSIKISAIYAEVDDFITGEIDTSEEGKKKINALITDIKETLPSEEAMILLSTIGQKLLTYI